MDKTPRCLIVDLARHARSPVDQEFSSVVATSFSNAGWQVDWAVDMDDPLEAPAGVRVHRILRGRAIVRCGTPSIQYSPGVSWHAKPVGRRPFAELETWGREKWKHGSTLMKPLALIGWVSGHVGRRVNKRLRAFLATHSDDASPESATRIDTSADCAVDTQPGGIAADGASTEGVLTEGTRRSGESSAASGARELLCSMRATDVIVFPSAEPLQLEGLLELLPQLRVTDPIDTTLHVRLTSDRRLLEQRGDVDRETLEDRLQSGCPFRNLVLHADTKDQAREFERELNLPVHDLGPATPDLVKALAPFDASGNSRRSLTIDAFGPIVLLVSAYWGRTGSTSIFDAQTRYLISRGCILLRIFVEHWPNCGHDYIGENFESLRPHTWFVVERNEDPHYVSTLVARTEFRDATPVKRMMMLFAEPTSDDPEGLLWAAQAAQLAIVNHLPHVLFTERLTSAPLVFETHDIYSDLLRKHGVPEFVPTAREDDDKDAWLDEERETWSRVCACVNLSPHDHAMVGPGAEHAALIRPYSGSRNTARRSWPEVVRSNDLPDSFMTTNLFDIMLWGDWHGVNVDGIRWFIDEVVPLSERLREARIVLVGRVAMRLPEGWAEAAGIHVAGFVDKLDDFIARAKVLVIPDQGGSGLSIKAMDALSRGRVFACTSGGMRSIDTTGTGYHPHDDPRELATDIERLLESRAARFERAALARRIYELNFSREAYAGAWDDLLRAAVPELMGQLSIPEDSRARGEDPPSAPEARTQMSTEPLQTPRLSVVICTYSRYDVLPDAIESVLRQDVPPGFLEIIVVDNSPDQEAADRFGSDYADEPVVRYDLEPVPGLSNARNKGARLAKAPIIAYIDDDAIAATNWAAELVAAFEAHPNAAVVGGRALPRFVSERPPWLHDYLLGYLSIVDWGPERRELREGEWVAGCNIAYDRDILLRVGGFSVALGRSGAGYSLLSNEEIEVTEKIHDLGKISLYAPDASVEHVIDPGRLTRAWFRRRAAWQAVSDFIKDGKKATSYGEEAGQHLRWALEDGSRSVPVGFFHATDDSERFKNDVDLMYNMIMAALTGGPELEEHEQRQ